MTSVINKERAMVSNITAIDKQAMVVEYVGIITEREIFRKVVAKGRGAIS